ncbi:MAG: glucose-6-phosphate isomerase [Candidatus Marinimicrobia bacterium]|nr:glucose-6-phosphate isomerase [Candidatus Neomarinimicrobiota bacterium]RPG05368.1 MAG: glucose-6-phosphate isomerase [Pelagibacteraceae bacterium TMED247]
MITSSKIINEIIESRYGLYKTFFPETKYNFNFKKVKYFKKFETVILIGMGGSILGTKAIYSFLEHKIKKKFIFLDNLDEKYLLKIKKEINLKKALFMIVSKSGNTNETIINSSFFKSFFKKKNVIIVSEERNNILFNFSKNKDFYFVRHHPNIGGRYSVFSDVGMLPAYLMGLEPRNFKKNIPKLLNSKKLLSENIKKLLKLKIKKNKIIILFSYAPELNDFLFWCQQLFSESLGKNKKGFIPVVSNGPKDHHSLLQLYLDGPKDKIFYVFSSLDQSKIKVNTKIFGKKVNFLNKKSYEKIKLSQKNAFIKTLKEKKIPYREIVIKKHDEKTLGQLFFLFIFETIFFSKILKVNPFDQPGVERVKVIAEKLLRSK